MMKFDAEWYLEHYPDIVDSGLSALDHYLTYGHTEGRQPSHFDAAWYLKAYPDVAESGMDPLMHYVNYGGPLEGRLPFKSANKRQ